MSAQYQPALILSPAEQDCLRLLAQGHEIKGIAAELGCSVHAVNERLRSARAKLGATSSREAARRFIAVTRQPQKICPEISGLADGLADRTISVAPAPSAGLKKDAILMTAAAFLIGSFLAWSLAGPGSANPAPPRAVATLPAGGAVIPPGPFVLSVSFDQAMRDGSWSFVRTDEGAFPECDGKPRLSPDRRTISMRCVAVSGQRYAVWFNRGRYTNFRSAEGGVAAVPSKVQFRAR